MGEFDVSQRTKDGYFNASLLMKQWNESSGMKKEINKFIQLESTKLFLTELKLDLENTQDSTYFNNARKTHESTRGKSGGVWMHPFLFIEFAMWLNPKFKLKVIKFVHDELMKNRHLAADHYQAFIGSCMKLEWKPMDAAKTLNLVVFNDHYSGIRNDATEDQLDDLYELEKKYTMLISEDFISDIFDLKEALRKEWRKRHNT